MALAIQGRRRMYELFLFSHTNDIDLSSQYHHVCDLVNPESGAYFISFLLVISFLSHTVQPRITTCLAFLFQMLYEFLDLAAHVNFSLKEENPMCDSIFQMDKLANVNNFSIFLSFYILGIYFHANLRLNILFK